MRRVSSWIVATPSDRDGATSSPFMGRRPPLETKVARTMSNVLQRSIPPCASRTKFKSSGIVSSPICAKASVPGPAQLHARKIRTAKSSRSLPSILKSLRAAEDVGEPAEQPVRHERARRHERDEIHERLGDSPIV